MVKIIVAMTTYNLENYIEQAIVSVLNQKTTFDYRLVIADDCSSDNTINILTKYQRLYPDKITLLLSEKNMGSLKNSNRIFSCIKSEYFIFLDGDDYWTDNLLIQKLVEYLEQHSDCSMCGGNTQLLRNNTLCDLLIDESKCNHDYNFQSFLNNTIPFVHTSALMVRNCIFNKGLPNCFYEVEDTFENCALRGEDFRRILHLEVGNLHLLSDVLSVYRIHDKGIWQGSKISKRVIEEAIGMNFLRKFFKNKYELVFENKFKEAYRQMWSVLIFDCDLFNECTLSAEEISLLSSLLTDLSSLNMQSGNIKKLNLYSNSSLILRFKHKLIKYLSSL